MRSSLPTVTRRGVIASVVSIALFLIPVASAASAPVTERLPESRSDAKQIVLTGPVTGGNHGQSWGAAPAKDLTAAGYMEEEYFFGGKATAFAQEGSWNIDGVWPVKAASEADYKVRMLVRRPADARKFNGIVVMEWLNVTALSEGAADFIQMQEELFREGYVWVGVGAQAAGLNAARTGLKAWDPARYESLSHPGDAYSYDIFSHAAQAIRRPAKLSPLGPLQARKILATGRSQSAFRLVTYINAIHPMAHAYDGFLIHSRGALPAPLSDGPDGRAPSNSRVRSDADVPVLCLQTEGDMITLRSHLARQDQSNHFRQWEIAGAAHAEVPRWVVETPPALDLGPGRKDPVNAAPHHAVVKAALHALARWVRDGIAPPQSPRIELDDVSAADPISRDKYGNAKGGIRLPELEAPTATLSGRTNSPAGQAGSGKLNFCFLFGLTLPFDQEALKALYPSHDGYVKQFNRAVAALERDGFWLKPEADQARQAAERSHIGG